MGANNLTGCFNIVHRYDVLLPLLRMTCTSVRYCFIFKTRSANPVRGIAHVLISCSSRNVFFSKYNFPLYVFAVNIQ